MARSRDECEYFTRFARVGRDFRRTRGNFAAMAVSPCPGVPRSEHLLELPGVMTYGASREEAILKAEALALRVIADRLERRETRPTAIHIALPATA